ncbi:MAG TPA: hypothetical protein VMU64_03435 [Acidimicrobiales bacterium]|nr:hypothetical protein [Acidimicrobiales bacterium]
MTEHIFGALGLLAVVSAGGTVWLLVRDERGRSRPSSARALRITTAVSALVVLGTVAFLRPWYWDLVISAAVVAAMTGFHVLVRALERRTSPASWGAIALAMVSVVLGSALVMVGATAAVIDGAALVGGSPVPVAHDRQVLPRPVLFQVFWGPSWDGRGATPALAQAAAFQRSLPTAPWASAVVGSGFGVGSIGSGGCWVDPTEPKPSVASSTSTGPFPQELDRVFHRHVRVVPCPGFTSTETPQTLPTDAVVAVWVDPGVAYELGGVSAHSSVPWPGRVDGLATMSLTGGFAHWGESSCAESSACRSVPSFASPTYALSHELVETITNPFGHGWYANVPLRWAARYFLSHGPTSLLSTAPAFEGEIADLCEPGQTGAPKDSSAVAPGPQQAAPAAFYRPGTGCVS